MTLRVLAIDTSTGVASVAVLDGASVLSQQEAAHTARHDHILLPRIEATLHASGLALADLGLLAVGLGPGTFGGLRVGLATIKGLAIATALPVVGVSSLHALCLSAPANPEFVLALQDAHRGEVYAALYQRVGESLAERMAPCMGTPRDVFTKVRGLCATVPHLVGSGLAAHRDLLLSAWPELDSSTHSSEAIPSARHIGSLATSLFEHRGADDAATLLPLYLRDSDAKLPTTPLHLHE